MQTDCLPWAFCGWGRWDLFTASYITSHKSFIEFSIMLRVLLSGLIAAAALTLRFCRGVLLCIQASRSAFSASASLCLESMKLKHVMPERRGGGLAFSSHCR